MRAVELKEKYQVLPCMPPEQFQALKAGIAERGVLTPIDVDEGGHILDGHHRYRACVELGISDFPTIVRPGMSEEDRRMFARKANMLRRHLSRDQVRLLIAAQLKDTPHWADNRIAQALGVDSKTVAVSRRSLEATSEIPKLDRLIGVDGKERPTKRLPVVMAHNIDELKKILARLAEGGTVEGFVAGVSGLTFTDSSYNPFVHCDEAGIREWKLFTLFGMDWRHVEWILQRQFKTPTEWLGDEGARWRKRCGLGEVPVEFVKCWEAFLETHRNSEIDNGIIAKRMVAA